MIIVSINMVKLFHVSAMSVFNIRFNIRINISSILIA